MKRYCQEATTFQIFMSIWMTMAVWGSFIKVINWTPPPMLEIVAAMIVVYEIVALLLIRPDIMPTYKTESPRLGGELGGI